jgi:electron transport complex protein RnfC
MLSNCNAMLAFNAADAKRPEESPCIHCGKCVNHCPFGLNPPGFAQALAAKDYEALQQLKVNLCMECGCCAFICPAKRNLVSRNKLAKAALRTYQQEQAAKEKAKEA